MNWEAIQWGALITVIFTSGSYCGYLHARITALDERLARGEACPVCGERHNETVRNNVRQFTTDR